jgi:DNA-binding NarL/FixJ family response regulator
LLLLAAELTAWNFDPDESVAAAREAVAAARRARAYTAEAEYVLSQALLVRGSPSCIRRAAAARRMAAATGRPDLELEAWSLQLAALQMFGQAQTCARVARLLHRAAAQRGKPIWEQRARWTIARVRWLADGELADSGAALVSLVDSRALGLRRPQLLADLALVLADSGESERARHVLSRARRAANTAWTAGVAASFSAELEWVDRRFERAVAEADAALAEWLPTPVELVARTARAWSLFELGRVAADDRLALAAPPILAGAALEGAAFAALAAGHLDDAAERLREAAQAWAGNVVRNELRALWGAARLAADAGETKSARTQLAFLERRAARLGYAGILARVRTSTQASSAGRTRNPPQPTLSARETEVLKLVARGRTSGEIAATLMLSRKTVETHIAHARSKLGAATRLHAATLATASPPAGAQSVVDPLLDLLARGITVTEAASRLGISRRTATRRVEHARNRLGVASTTEAVIRARVDPGCLNRDDRAGAGTATTEGG